MQGVGLASVTSLRLRLGSPSFLLPPSSSPPPTHVALATASSFPPRGWGTGPLAPLQLTCRSPWQPPPLARAAWECECPGSATVPTGAHRARVRNKVETTSKPSPPNSLFRSHRLLMNTSNFADVAFYIYLLSTSYV